VVSESFPPRSDRSSYKWAVIGMLWCVCLLNYADRQAIFSVFPLLKTQMHLSDVQLGLVGSSFMWMYALCGPFAGSLSDRFSRKYIVLGALVFWSFATAATALTQTFTQLMICRALGGLGEAFYFPAAMSLISDYHGAGTRSRAMSLHQSGVYAGTIAGGALSGLIGQSYGWRSSFVFWGAAGLLLGAVLWFVLREPQRGMSDPALTAQPAARASLLEGFRDVLSQRRVVLLIAVFMAANFVAVVFLTWMPTFLVQKFHMSLAMAGFSGTAYLQIASVCGVLLGGLMADTLRRKRSGGRLLTQSIGLLCGVPFLLLTGWTTRVAVLIGGLAGFGFFKGMYDANIFAGLYDNVPIHRRGAAAGLLNSLGWLGGGFAPVLIAVAAARFGLGACISATAVIYFTIAIALFAGSRSMDRAAGTT
jgi:predicted MFS family arabinose efflux permease